MAYGAIARDPSTPYLVYGFAWKQKTFYVGIAQVGKTRHTGRWTYVANLRRHQRAGTLTAAKEGDLVRPSNAVIAELQRMGLEEHSVHILWTGTGRASAEVEEVKLIQSHLDAGCVLANVHGGRGASVLSVLAYLGGRDQ